MDFYTIQGGKKVTSLTVSRGDQVTLFWAAVYTASITITPDIGYPGPLIAGNYWTFTPNPDATTTYILTASNGTTDSAGKVTAEVTIAVQ